MAGTVSSGLLFGHKNLRELAISCNRGFLEWVQRYFHTQSRKRLEDRRQKGAPSIIPIPRFGILIMDFYDPYPYLQVARSLNILSSLYNNLNEIAS